MKYINFKKNKLNLLKYFNMIKLFRIFNLIILKINYNKYIIVEFYIIKNCIYNLIDYNEFLEKYIILYYINYFLKNTIYLYQVQKNIFNKIINLNYNKYYIIFNKKNESSSNISTYIDYTFPKFISNFIISNSPMYKELYVQLKLLNVHYNYFTNVKIKTYKILDMFDIYSINNIFEIKEGYEFNCVITNLSIILNNVFIYKKYTLYIKNICSSNNITSIDLLVYNNIIINKFKINFGGSIIILNKFIPKQILKNFFINTKNLNSTYISSKYSLLYIYNILIESLYKQYSIQGLLIPYILFELFIKKMVSFVKVIYSGDTTFYIGEIITLSLLNLINISYILNGYIECKYIPIVLGIVQSTLGISGLLSTISFQDTIKNLSKLVLYNKIDWFTDLKSKIIMSELIDSGTGWYKKFCNF